MTVWHRILHMTSLPIVVVCVHICQGGFLKIYLHRYHPLLLKKRFQQPYSLIRCVCVEEDTNDTTDLLSCVIGMESNLYAVSCALTSRLCKNADPRRLNCSVMSSLLDSFPTCLSNSDIPFSFFTSYTKQYT